MLKEYLQSVQAWGCPESGIYSHGFGLCINTFRFLPGDWKSSEKLRIELEEALATDGLDPDYPFDSSAEHYENKCFLLSIWDNPQRLAWVKKHAETLP